MIMNLHGHIMHGIIQIIKKGVLRIMKQYLKKFMSRMVAFVLIFSFICLDFMQIGYTASSFDLGVETVSAAENEFQIDISWVNSDLDSENHYSLVAKDNTSNAVCLRVSYSSARVIEGGYAPGELVITVNGIGDINRDGIIQAIVGADRANASTKTHDWSYTWNKTNDTYTFTNNCLIEANSVLSGYFDLVWSVNARDSIHGYTKDDIQAEVLLPDGTSVVSDVLSIENTTVVDTFTVDIATHNMYGYEGLTAGIENPDDYFFVRYDLNTAFAELARGTDSYSYVFNPDAMAIGSINDAKVIATQTSVTDLGDGTYRVSMPQSTALVSKDYYVFVAYPKSVYSEKTITASLGMYGSFYENDTTNLLAMDNVSLEFTSDFSFDNIPSDVLFYGKNTYYDKYVLDEVTAAQGGDIRGSKMVDGTTEVFYLNGALFYSEKNAKSYRLEMVDDYLYILQNGGTYRRLESDEYHFESVTIPGTGVLKNSNDTSIASGVYPVKVYAFTNGATVSLNDANYLVFDGMLEAFQQNVVLPENTTSIEIVIEDLSETIASFSIPMKIAFHLKDTSSLEYALQDNLDNGKVVNTTFDKLFDENGIWLNEYTEDNYHDDTNLNLADFDKTTYGGYFDRERAEITFYAGEKSDYVSSTNFGSIVDSSDKFTSTFTMGSSFSFHESDYPTKFSLYTVLPEHVTLDNYELSEDLYNIMTLSGMELDEQTLSEHCTPEVILNYRNTGRTYIALHFDFSGIDVLQSTKIQATFQVKIDGAAFKNSSVTLIGRSSVMIDDTIDEYTFNKYTDNGYWSSTSVFSDIDDDGIVDEYLSYSTDFTSYIYADSSELQMTKYVKTSNISDYVQLPEIPLAEEGANYTYKLSLKNGNSIVKDLVVTDLLESGENAQWHGVFDHIDLQEADKLGLDYTVFYADIDAPEESDWTTTMDSADVKAIKIDFGSSELQPGAELNLFVSMIAPIDMTLRNQVTENNFLASFTMVSVKTGSETKMDSLTSNFVQVKLTAELKNVVVTKFDATSGGRVCDAVYSLIEKDTGTVVATGTTNYNGQIIFKKVSSDKEYIIHEDTSPSGYEVSDDVDVVFTNAMTTYVPIYEIRKKGTISLYKTHEADPHVKVEGAEFTLFTADGTEVAKAETNINGKLMFEDLEWGEYYVQETKAPDGYLLDNTKRSISITQETVEMEQVLKITNQQANSTQVIFQKYEMTTSGVQTENPLSGAVFSLVRQTGGQDVVIGTYVTDANGQIVIDDLPYGDYALRESRVPAGYLKTEDVSFSLSSDVLSVDLIAYDKRKTGTINLYKKDNLDNIVVGAIFELYDETQSNVLGTYTTDDAGMIQIANLEWGTYYLKEKSTLDCYVLSTDWIEVVIDGTHLNVDLTCVNETKKGTIVLNKTDELGLTFLEGAVFNLYENDGTLLQQDLVTDENGQIRVENLEWGKYYFKETKAPDGYGLNDETIRFAVNSMTAGMEQSLYVSDPLDSKVITITKKILAEDINFANGNPTFLFKVSGTDVNQKEHTYYRILKFDETYVDANTDENGFVSQSVTFSGLTAGVYTASEEESSRYCLDDIIDVSSNATVSDDTVVIDIQTESDGSATFVNGKYEHADYSDNQSAANSLKAQAKLTGLKVTWAGDTIVTAKSEIDRSLLTVIACYDDGSYRKLSDTDWSFGDMFSGTIFPNINGEYSIPISYTEGSITRTGYFDVTIEGAVKEYIIRLEASVNEDSQTVTANSLLSEDMFTVTAVYNDGSKSFLETSDYQLVTKTAPNSEGLFAVELGLHPDVFDYEVFTFVNMTSKFVEPILIRGGKFSSNIPRSSSVTSVAFVDETAPTNASIVDLSAAGNWSVVGWLDGSVWKISSQRKGVKVIANVDSSQMFSAHVYLTTIDFTYFDTSRVELMYNMFFGCNALTSLDLSSFNTSRVTNMCNMFNSCHALSSVNVSSFDTRNVVYMNGMFCLCKALQSLDLSNFNTEKVITMHNMFNSCYELSSLNISNFNTSNVTNMTGMFYLCKYLPELDVSSFNTSKVTTMENMFNSCYKLSSLNISNFNTSNVTDMEGMFCSCKILQSLDLSNFNTEKVITMRNMFNSCYELSSLNISNFNTSNVTSMDGMFYSCKYLPELDVSSFNTSKVTTMENMFRNCASLIDLDVSNFDTQNVTNMAFMFSNSVCLENLDVSNFNTENVTTMAHMFEYTAVRTLDLSSFVTPRVTDMSYMFDQCWYLSSLDISNFDTRSVTDMSRMFDCCNSLLVLDLSSFDMTNVSNVSNMLNHCGYGEIKAYARTQVDADILNDASKTGISDYFVFIVKPAA